MATTGGFSPVRHLNGINTFQTQRFKKNTALGDASLIYVGDPVVVGAAGTVSRLLAAQVTAAGGQIGTLGVAARVLINEEGRPRVHGLPTQHPNISLTADADYIDVYVDPNIVYECKVDTSASEAMIGQTMNITTTARVTAAGISGTILDSASSASTFNPFKVLQVSDFSLDTRAGDASGRVHAVVNYSWLKSTDTV